MDTGKLLQIIQDTQDEESIISTQTIIKNIVSYYSQNTAAALESIAAEKRKLHTVLTETSPISKYAHSDFSALTNLGVSTIFGPGLYQRLENALLAPTYEVTNLLQTIITERELAIANLASIQTGMVHFNLKSRSLDNGNFEIGFTLPDFYADLDKTEIAIKDLRLVLESLADAINSQQPLRIKYVSNGTVEYFIHAGLELAQNFDILLDYAIRIYTAIKMYEDGKKFLDKLTTDRKKQSKKLVDEQKVDDTNKLIEDMVKELEIPEDKKAEFTGRFKGFLKHIESGVGAEVRTPKISEPKDPGEDASKEQKAAYKQSLTSFKNKKEIDERNRQIFVLQQNNFYGMDTKFLTESTNNSMDESI